MILPPSEPLPERTVEERLEAAKPKLEILSSGQGSNADGSIRELLYPTTSWPVDVPLGKRPS